MLLTSSTQQPPSHTEEMQNLNDTSMTPNASLMTPETQFLPCDNPRNVLSPHVTHVVHLGVYAGLLPVLAVNGIVTNLINMRVFVRQGLSDRIHLCLFSLALSDTGYLLCLMAGKSYALIGLISPAAGRYWEVGHYDYVKASVLAFQVISNAITAIISMERCLCILSPLKAAKFFSTKHTGVGLLVMGTYTLVVLNVCFGIKYDVVHVTNPLTNTSTYITRLSPLYLRHRNFLDVIYLYMLLVSVPFISFIVVIVCTSAIIIRLKVTSRWRRESASTTATSSEKQEATLTRMLVTVCCVYVVCITPSVVKELLLSSRFPGFLTTGHLCNVFNVTVALTHLLEALNSSVNFYIYLKQSSRFRSTLGELCHCKKQIEPTSSSGALSK